MIAGFAVFESCIGPVGIGWSARGLRRVWLASTEWELRASVARDAPDAEESSPPPRLAALPRQIAAHLWGRAPTYEAPIDWSGITPFRRAVFEVLRGTSAGEVLTYGELAARAERPGAARAVGGAMASNVIPVVIPCHRVVAAGHAGGYSAHGGLRMKSLLVAREGGQLPGVRYPRYGGREVLRVLRRDAELRRAVDRIGTFAMTLRPRSTVFSSLARAIVFQQLSGKAAGTIFRRLVEACGGRLDAASLAGTGDEALRAAGLSRPKLRALRDVSRRTIAGELPEREELEAMDDEAIVEALCRAKGVGRWTVQMLLLFQLGRPDVLAVDDLGLRKAYGALLGRPVTRAELAAAGDAWRPYRSAASWYLWRTLDGLP